MRPKGTINVDAQDVAGYLANGFVEVKAMLQEENAKAKAEAKAQKAKEKADAELQAEKEAQAEAQAKLDAEHAEKNG